MWQRLKQKQLDGFKFRRQYSIDHFVADFYCSQTKLVIELDGDSHFASKEIKEYDQYRQQAIEQLGLNILRFTNLDVKTNIEGVLERIRTALHTSAPILPLAKGELEGVCPERLTHTSP